MSLSLHLLALVLVAEGIVLALLVILYLWYGLWFSRKRRHDRVRIHEAKSILALAVTSGEISASDFTYLQGLPLILRDTTFTGLSSYFSGEQREWIRGLSEEFGLVDHARKNCQSRFWWRRLEGIRVFMLLGGGEEAVLPLLQDSHQVVRSHAIEWASDHPSQTVLEILASILHNPSGPYHYVVQDSLFRMGRAAIETLGAYLARNGGESCLLALEVASWSASPDFEGPAIAGSNDELPRVRATAATLLGALGGAASESRLTEMLDDPEPIVRDRVAQALTRSGDLKTATRLATLLNDPHPDVRQVALSSLEAMGSPGILVMRRFFRSLDMSPPVAAKTNIQ